MFRVIAERKRSHEFGTYIAYGIAAPDNIKISDICTETDRVRLEDLVRQMNFFHLSLIHLYDVVEDFLLDY